MTKKAKKNKDKSVKKKGSGQTKKTESALYISSYSNISSGGIVEEIKKIKDGRRPSPEPKKQKPKKIPFDWAKVDKRGKPIISFNPSPEEREKMIEILNLTMRKPVKRRLVEKLGKEFGRAYQRYRRALERAEGKRGHWLLGGTSMKQAQAAGERCIRKGITPFQVLRYWHEHIGDVCDGSMKIPPLGFISSEQAIETVACANLEQEGTRVEFGNSFVSMNQLDPNLRKVLTNGGFDIDELNDEHLLQIQHAAIAKKSGFNFFVSKKIKRMIKYLNKNYYKDKNEK